MFQFAPLALPTLWVQVGVTDGQVCWVAPFGYLRIDASSSSPERFVGLHALRRLCVPRYPPRALGRLTIYASFIGDSSTCLLFIQDTCVSQTLSLLMTMQFSRFWLDLTSSSRHTLSSPIGATCSNQDCFEN